MTKNVDDRLAAALHASQVNAKSAKRATEALVEARRELDTFKRSESFAATEGWASYSAECDRHEETKAALELASSQARIHAAGEALAIDARNKYERWWRAEKARADSAKSNEAIALAQADDLAVRYAEVLDRIQYLADNADTDVHRQRLRSLLKQAGQ